MNSIRAFLQAGLGIVLLVVVMACADPSGAAPGSTGPDNRIRGWPEGREGALHLLTYHITRLEPSYYIERYLSLGSIPVASSGRVDLRLPSPLLDSEIHPYLARLLCTGGESNFASSNSGARFALMVPVAVIGTTVRAVAVPSSRSFGFLPFPLGIAPGDRMAAYLYADQDVRITGRCNKSAQVYTPEQRLIFDLELSSGWNYLVGELVSLEPITVSVRATRTLPAGLSLTYVTLPIDIPNYPPW